VYGSLDGDASSLDVPLDLFATLLGLDEREGLSESVQDRVGAKVWHGISHRPSN
jgi:hypothetical protein